MDQEMMTKISLLKYAKRKTKIRVHRTPNRMCSFFDCSGCSDFDPDQDHLATLHELSEIEEDDNDDDDEDDDYAYDYQNEDDRQAYDANDDHYYEDRSIDDDKKSLMECEEVVNAQFRNAELEQVIDREKQLRQSFNPMPFNSATDWLTVSS